MKLGLRESLRILVLELAWKIWVANQLWYPPMSRGPVSTGEPLVQILKLQYFWPFII